MDVKKEKAKKFAISIVKLSKFLTDKKEFIISNQILRSGISIGANLAESEFAQSKEDFIHKMSIALKEANETRYWLELLHETEQITQELSNTLINDCSEIIGILVSSLKTLKS
ncbi:MAG: four helix bundle protein [Firmicutes bacterium]|nr:four helix bundle protein [Bacillota bacterium]